MASIHASILGRANTGFPSNGGFSVSSDDVILSGSWPHDKKLSRDSQHLLRLLPKPNRDLTHLFTLFFRTCRNRRNIFSEKEYELRAVDRSRGIDLHETQRGGQLRQIPQNPCIPILSCDKIILP